jgi:choline-sulfatase
MLMTDNQRLDTIGAIGQTPCLTPTWDRVANEGVLCDHLRTTSPICSPARASIFTGKQPQQAGMPHLPYIVMASQGEPRPIDAPTDEIQVPPISHYLRQKDYNCLYTGKWNLGDSNIGKYFDWFSACDQDDRDYTGWCKAKGIREGRIFHDPDPARYGPFRSKHHPHMSVPRVAALDIPEEHEYNRWVIDRAFEVFEQRDRNRPLFMSVNMEGPHPPLIVPKRYLDMYDPAAITEPTNWGSTEDEPGFLESSYYRRLWREWGEDFDSWRKPLAVYWGFCTYIDELLGRFLTHVEREIGLDNTLVMMLSDHGEQMGQHGLWQKFCPYEEALRVPLVVRWPGVIDAGSRLSMDVSHVDVAATLLAAGGLDPAEAEVEGEDLLPYITGQHDQPESRDCFTQYNLAPDFASWHGVPSWRCLVRRPWKYVLHADGQQELYHLIHDPNELINLAGQPEQVDTVNTLRRALMDWCQRTGDERFKREMETAKS